MFSRNDREASSMAIQQYGYLNKTQTRAMPKDVLRQEGNLKGLHPRPRAPEKELRDAESRSFPPGGAP